MGNAVQQKSQSQDDEEDKKPKYVWVPCPDMPEGLLTVDDESPHKRPKEKGGDLEGDFM